MPGPAVSTMQLDHSFPGYSIPRGMKAGKLKMEVDKGRMVGGWEREKKAEKEERL